MADLRRFERILDGFEPDFEAPCTHGCHPRLHAEASSGRVCEIRCTQAVVAFLWETESS